MNSVGVASQSTGPREGVFKNAAGEVVGGWKTLDAASTPGSGAFATSSAFPEEQVGGGTWRYGTYTDANYYKHCWSHYYHGSVKHHATAIMNATVKTYANAGSWAYAEPSPFPTSHAGPCSVYWGKDA